LDSDDLAPGSDGSGYVEVAGDVEEHVRALHDPEWVVLIDRHVECLSIRRLELRPGKVTHHPEMPDGDPPGRRHQRRFEVHPHHLVHQELEPGRSERRRIVDR
jgi:hypothetical protein